MKINENYSMKNKSNMKIGGIAKVFIEIEDKSDLTSLNDKYKDYFLIGNGTNTLIYDGYLDTVFVSLKHLDKISEISHGCVRVEAGADFSKVINYMKVNNYSGLENLAGIPGTVGGLAYMNGGAYGTEISECIEELEIFDRNTKEIRTLKKHEAGFSYRHTAVQENNWIILSILFSFKDGFDSNKVMELQALRESKQPLNLPSLGSTFKNPKGDFAARLISEAGLKGTIIGGAQISPKHPNFVVNLGSATFNDIIEILKLVKSTVKEKFNLQLEEEIIIIKE